MQTENKKREVPKQLQNELYDKVEPYIERIIAAYEKEGLGFSRFSLKSIGMQCAAIGYYHESDKDQLQDTTLVPIEDNYIRIGDKMKFNEESDAVTCIDCNEKQVKSRGGWYDREGTIKVKDSIEDTELNATPGEWESRGNKIFIVGKTKSIATFHVQKAWDDNFNPIRDVEQEGNQSLCLQSKNMYAMLKRANEELQYLLNEVQQVRPGSYRASTTIRDIKQLLNNCKPKP